MPMRTHPDILENAAAGERVEILRRADEEEDRIDLRITLDRVGAGPGLHVHPTQTERFHVLHGELRVVMGSQDKRLGPGEGAVVPPGTVHTFRALAAGTQVDVRVSPALRFEAALEAGYELYESGALSTNGPVDVEAAGAFYEEYAEVFRRPPHDYVGPLAQSPA
jgi:mannose-6-phosphate isomerase-like protein (cupin superfamily)